VGACGYHCSAKSVSFGKGQSAVHTAAYNARDQLYRAMDGQTTKDYSRHGEVLFSGIFAPAGAPDWVRDRQELWNRAEAAERQKNGQPARNVFVAFPHELNQQQREWLIKDFAREQFARQGMIADVAMHPPDRDGDQRNTHAHILVTMRKLDGDNFAKTKCRDWNSKAQLNEWREQWAEKGARALVRAGYEVEGERWRHGHKTLPEQHAAALARGDKDYAESLDGREATLHKGPKITAMERRGASSERMERLNDILARNDIRLEMKAIDREVGELQRAAGRQSERPAPEAFRGKEPGRVMDGAARAVEGVAGGVLRGVAKVLDGAASLFEGLLGGGPSPEQVQQAKDSAQASPPPASSAGQATPEPSPPRGPDSVEAYLAEERQRFAEERRQALLRDYGREVPPETERDAKIERDRGGGGIER